MLKAGVRTLLHVMGYDVVRYESSPERTLLGLVKPTVGAVIDIGANVGQFARIANKHFPQATLFCFEPLPSAFAALETWAAHRAPGKIQLFNIALGDTIERVPMYVHADHEVSSSLLETTELVEALYPLTKAQTPIQVDITTLDEAMSPFLADIEGDLLIKLDVQGFEDRVLRGATKTLERAQSVILEIGLDPLYRAQAQFEGLVSILNGRGFRYAGNLGQTYASDGHVVFVDAVFQRRTPPD